MTIITSPEKMHNLGKQYAQKYTHILLYGALGAGKTQFCKGYADGLGINPTRIHSPTYTYMHIYDSMLLHIDMYNIHDHMALQQKGIIEQLGDYDHIIIERPNYEELYLHDYQRTHIDIEKISVQERRVTVHHSSII